MGELITGYSVDVDEVETQVEEEVTQYLTFHASEKIYAIEILDVDEIIEVAELTDVPMTPDYIRGVMNLRGQVIPIIDLAARMQREQQSLSKRSCIVLVEIKKSTEKQQAIGILVDAVNEIVEIPQANIKPSPNLGEGVHTEFIQAMGKINDKFVILLDIDHLLTEEQLGQLEQLADAAPESV